METLRRWNHETLQLIRRNRRRFDICQVGFYGTTLACMVLATARPEMTDGALKAVDKELDRYEAGRWVKKLYDQGNLTGAAGMTFGINTLIGSFATITLNSLIIPYSGLALGLYRAGYWGILFPPWGKGTTAAHLLTLVLEGQAYVWAGFGSWLLSDALVNVAKAWWSGKSPEVKEESKKGLVNAIKDNAKLYVPVVGILAVSAVWEAFEVIHIGGFGDKV